MLNLMVPFIKWGLEIKEIAHAIAQAVFDFDSNLIFVGLANTLLISEAELVGLKVASEVC